MECQALKIAGRELRIHITQPDKSASGEPTMLVILPDITGLDDCARGWVRRFAEVGYASTILELAEMALSHSDMSDPDAVERALDQVWDGYVLQDLRALLGWLRERGHTSVIAIGFGLGGTIAFLGAGSMMRLAGTINIGGRILYPTLSERKPIQPLDLLPGLKCPLQCHFGERDPLVKPIQVDTLRSRLAPRALSHQVCTYPGAGLGFFNPQCPGYDSRIEQTTWTRVSAFVRHCFFLETR